LCQAGKELGQIDAKLSSQGPAHSSGRLLIIAVFASLAVRQYQRLSR
jgi:hypothetical protein